MNRWPQGPRAQAALGEVHARSTGGTLIHQLRDDLVGWQPRLQLANMLLAPLPPFVASRLRMYVLRAVGFRVGRGTMMWGMPTIIGSGDIYSRLTIGAMTVCNLGVVFDLEAPITIGSRAAIGHQVMILTSSYKPGPPERRAGERLRAPVTIEDGAWLGARCVILPGVTIGAGAVIAAGSVVKQDVLPDTLIAGERTIRTFA